jgi:hypothetical protein
MSSMSLLSASSAVCQQLSSHLIKINRKRYCSHDL